MSNQHILIIDDDEVDRKIASRALTQAGWKGVITQAATAEEARRFVDKYPIECILLDYHLPGIEGLDFLTELHGKLGIKVPIIMLTALGNEMVAVDAMKRGAHDYLPKSHLTPDTLYRVVSQTLEKSRLEQELAEVREELVLQAHFDSLTGLGNRRLLIRDLALAIANAARSHKTFYLFFMDLNKFKAANDRYGHEAGDAILVEIGKRLKTLSRSNDIYYRQGGDEFAALVDVAKREDTIAFVERIKRAVSAPIAWNGVKLLVGISIGVASYPNDGNDLDSLFRAADVAMYRDKHLGTSVD